MTSQFENHLRAVLDLPLGVTDLVAPAVATVNVLGPADGSEPRERLADALGVPSAPGSTSTRRIRCPVLRSGT